MRKRRLALGCGTLGLIALTWATGEAQETPSPKAPSVPSIQGVYQSDVRPILKKYCFECHGEVKPKGDIRLDTLSVDFVKGKEADLEVWHDVLQNLHRAEMPPRDKLQPTKQEHGVIVDWLNRAFVEARQQRESTGGKIVTRRLTSYEFQNTLEDLLELKFDFSKNLLPESSSRDGFLNNGSILATSSQHVKTFWAAARIAMSKAIVTGPQPTIHKTRFVTYHPHFSMKPGKKQQMAKIPEPPSDNEYRDVLLPDTALMVPVAGLPAKGRFRIRINVRASGPDTYLLTWFKFGTADLPALALVKREVIASAENQTIDIHGNIEDFGYLADRLKKGVSPAAYLCVSNVGGNHAMQKIGTGTYLNAVDPAKVRQFLDVQAKDPKQADDASAVRINFIEIESPFIESPISDTWPPLYHRKILFDSPNVKDEPVYAREVIGRFMERAFRRPVPKSEVDPYVAAFQKMRPNVDAFEDAIRETLATVLVSPQFLMLVEPRAAKTGKASVTDYEWAARLSYFLWNSMPDAELIQLASNKGAFKDPAVRNRQVERLLQDPRSRRFIETLTDQWFDLSSLEKVAVNPEFHPKFDESLKQDMRRETQLFFNEFVKTDLSCLKLVGADFTYLNNRLADHYGIRHGPGTSLNLGLAFQRVSLAPEHKRGCGILTQASVLLLNSDGVESHPIKRAVWVRNAIFDDPPPDPPAEVPELKTEDRAKSKLTLKQRIEQHRSSPTCAHCHARVDPWGIVFEQYDALGRFRSAYSSLADPLSKNAKKAKLPAVDAKAELPDGHEIDGVEDLKSYILSHGKERFARAIVRKTLAYALGRSIEVGDQPLVEELTRNFAANDYRFRALIQAVVGSEAFLTK